MFFIPWALDSRQCVLSFLLLTKGKANINRFVIRKYSLFCDKVSSAGRVNLFFTLLTSGWDLCVVSVLLTFNGNVNLFLIRKHSTFILQCLL